MTSGIPRNDEPYCILVFDGRLCNQGSIYVGNLAAGRNAGYYLDNLNVQFVVNLSGDLINEPTPLEESDYIITVALPDRPLIDHEFDQTKSQLGRIYTEIRNETQQTHNIMIVATDYRNAPVLLAGYLLIKDKHQRPEDVIEYLEFINLSSEQKEAERIERGRAPHQVVPYDSRSIADKAKRNELLCLTYESFRKILNPPVVKPMTRAY